MDIAGIMNAVSGAISTRKRNEIYQQQIDALYSKEATETKRQFDVAKTSVLSEQARGLKQRSDFIANNPEDTKAMLFGDMIYKQGQAHIAALRQQTATQDSQIKLMDFQLKNKQFEFAQTESMVNAVGNYPGSIMDKQTIMGLRSVITNPKSSDEERSNAQGALLAAGQSSSEKESTFEQLLYDRSLKEKQTRPINPSDLPGANYGPDTLQSIISSSDRGIPYDDPIKLIDINDAVREARGDPWYSRMVNAGVDRLLMDRREAQRHGLEKQWDTTSVSPSTLVSDNIDQQVKAKDKKDKSKVEKKTATGKDIKDMTYEELVAYTRQRPADAADIYKEWVKFQKAE